MDLLKSKKFQAAIVGLIVAVLGETSLHLDQQALITVLSPIISYILGQAIADIGKEKAKVEAKNGQ